MVFKPGESGNPTGKARGKQFLDALNRSIAQEDGKRLRKSAEKLLDLAAEGESWAVQMLADRLDGKAQQIIAGPGDKGEHTLISKVEELIVDPKD